ncbi:MAG: hypothetical protein AAGA29_02110 [Planctomycetota bacterium]
MPDVLPAQVSDSHPEPAASAETTRALIRELHAAADRARDERLRLAQAQKQQRAHLDTQGGPAPADQVVKLTDKIQQLDRVVQDRLDTLAQTQHEIDIRTERVNAMRHVIQAATDAFAAQVEHAQQFKCDIDAAKQAVQACAGEVAEEVRQHLAQTEEPIATRLKQLVEMDRAIDKRVARMQQMHKQAAEAVDKHLARALNDAKEQATELAAPIKAELDRHLVERTGALEQAVQAKIAELDVDVEDALAPLTRRFDAVVADAGRRVDTLAASLPERVDDVLQRRITQGLADLDKQAQAQLAGLEADAAKRVTSITRIAQASGQSLAAALAKLADESRGKAEQAEQDIRRRAVELRKQSQHAAGLSVQQADRPRPVVPRQHPLPGGQPAPTLDPRYTFSVDLESTVTPVIQGSIVAESLDAYSKRAGRTPRTATQDAA